MAVYITLLLLLYGYTDCLSQAVVCGTLCCSAVHEADIHHVPPRCLYSVGTAMMDSSSQTAVVYVGRPAAWQQVSYNWNCIPLESF